MTDLTDNADCLHRAKPRGANSWSSATGAASRRNLLLAGRSLAAMFGTRPVSSGLASFRPSERNDSVRAAVRGSEVERAESW